MPPTHPTASPPFTIRPLDPTNPTHTPAARALISAYTAWLNLDLSFQAYEEEIASLPGRYSPSADGECLLAFAASTLSDTDSTPTDTQLTKPVGVIALRALPYTSTSPHFNSSRKRAELKRLWVDPAYRSLGIGVELVRRILVVADGLGYDECVLDTLPTMVGPRRMYQGFGFKRVEKYYGNDIDGVVFMGRELPGSASDGVAT
ncbi:MAG: hypothetical protein M1828_002774 [Chrysothrix sp. TS-e1954]|nr:MAG: hypothetical protein M1828_002774 [Chrysothrix sp. TS-e1954]